MRTSILSLFSIMILACAGQQELKVPVAHHPEIWSDIDTFFSPPEKWENKYGQYRSPLVSYAGDTVKTKKAWESRREEIRNTWMDLMGEWPPLLKNQELTLVDSIHKEKFTQYKIEFNWTPNEKTYGYLLVPVQSGEKPAVISVYYEPETSAGLTDVKNRDYAYQLALRGFITLSLGTKEASLAETYALYYPSIENAKIEPLSMLAYAAANAWYALANYPEVDSDRIGITGHSFGGKWSMFASCLFDKFACGAWSDPGIAFQNDRPSINYWEPWYLGYHPMPWRPRGLITEENPAVGLYPKLIKEGYNLQELHALMAPRPFLVSGGSEDPPSRWEILNHSVRVNKMLGYQDRVALENRPGHSPTPESSEVIYKFFEYFLKN